MKPLLTTLAVVTLLTGCVPKSELLYDWGAVSETQLKWIREPGSPNLTAHENALQAVIDQAKQHNKRVPPGVHCELGYLRFKQGRMGEAEQLYNAEIALYPESRIFMERLKSKIQATTASRPST
ncbi:MAG: DUF4810 domain-containing protein [Magnetococcales bacterium]|nr:DUF4810 domain-containing protein [Magnetococcales bacterium]